MIFETGTDQLEKNSQGKVFLDWSCIRFNWPCVLKKKCLKHIDPVFGSQMF